MIVLGKKTNKYIVLLTLALLMMFQFGCHSTNNSSESKGILSDSTKNTSREGQENNLHNYINPLHRYSDNTFSELTDAKEYIVPKGRKIVQNEDENQREFNSLIQVGDCVYYVGLSNNNSWALYNMRINGNEKYKILELDERCELFASDRYIFFSDYLIEKDTCSVTRLDISTGKIEVIITGNIEIEYIDHLKKCIYYSDQNGLYVSDFSGINSMKLLSNNCYFIRLVGDTIFFHNTGESLSGKKLEKGCTEFASLNIQDGKIKVITELSPYISGDNTQVHSLDIIDDRFILLTGNYGGGHMWFEGDMISICKDGSDPRYFLTSSDNLLIIESQIFNGFFLDKYLNEIDSKYDKNIIPIVFDKNMGIIYVEPENYSDLLLRKNDGESTILFKADSIQKHEDSDTIFYENIEVDGDYVYFAVRLQGYKKGDPTSGHTDYKAYYKVSINGEKPELIFEDILYRGLR